MSNRGPRNHQLLQQIANNPFRKAVAAAFDIASDLEKDMESVRLDRNLSEEGRQKAAQGHLRRAIRDLRDLKQPVEEFHAKTETMRATVKMPAFDKTDVVGFLRRQELRAASRALTPGQRAMHMTGKTRSADFIDAVLEQEAWVSGIDIYTKEGQDLESYEEAKESRLRDLHGPLLDTIVQRDGIKSEAMMILNVVRNDLAADSGIDSKDFEAEAKAIEARQNAPWLQRHKDLEGVERIHVVDVQNHRARIATPDEERDGVFFKDFAEYQASRAA